VPNRLAFTHLTAEFVSGFGAAFSAASGGNPNAVLRWADATTNDDKSVMVELLAADASSPNYDAGTQTLIYKVYGLRLDDRDTLLSFPADPQMKLEATSAVLVRLQLFIDD